MATLSEKAKSNGLTIRRAKPDDIPPLQAMITASYSKYIERIGKPPAPMLADYAQLLKTRDVFVLESTSEGEDGSRVAEMVGSILLGLDAGGDAVTVNNLVVEPAAQGRGYGRVLMDFAEDFAREKETERKTDDGYERVYFRKQLV